jgi:hypothetical protein
LELGKRRGSCLAIGKAGYGWTSLVVDLKAVNRVDQAVSSIRNRDGRDCANHRKGIAPERGRIYQRNGN